LTGTFTKSGSPKKAARSAKARRIASAITWSAADEPGPIAFRSKPSSTASICSSVAPPEDGGGMESTSSPRYVPRSTSRSATL
jgi:hypothetical protein